LKAKDGRLEGLGLGGLEAGRPGDGSVEF